MGLCLDFLYRSWFPKYKFEAVVVALPSQSQGDNGGSAMVAWTETRREWIQVQC